MSLTILQFNIRDGFGPWFAKRVLELLVFGGSASKCYLQRRKYTEGLLLYLREFFVLFVLPLLRSGFHTSHLLFDKGLKHLCPFRGFGSSNEVGHVVIVNVFFCNPLVVHSDSRPQRCF